MPANLGHILSKISPRLCLTQALLIHASPTIAKEGGTFERTFTEAGEYPYFCTLYPNMVGTVIVTK